MSEVSVPFLMEPSEQVELRDLGSITQPAIIYGKEEAVKYRSLEFEPRACFLWILSDQLAV